MRILENAFKLLFAISLKNNVWPTLKKIRNVFVTNDKANALWKRQNNDDYRQRCLDKVKSLYRGKKKMEIKKLKKLNPKKKT